LLFNITALTVEKKSGPVVILANAVITTKALNISADEITKTFCYSSVCRPAPEGVGMRTRLAIERAGTVTPHLKRGAPVLYPNPNGNGEQWIGRTYGAMAPVLDPTRQRFLS